MPSEVVYSPRAMRDLDEIWDYIRVLYGGSDYLKSLFRDTEDDV